MFKAITEDEARGKWCPFTRVVHYSASINRPHDNHTQEDAAAIQNATRCIASKCMAWREAVTPREGYCGLAGVPMGVRA